MAKYQFNGSGAGVPGLAHEISEEERARFNPDQVTLLNAALASGVYIEVPIYSGMPNQPVVHRKPKPKKSEQPSTDEGEQA